MQFDSLQAFFNMGGYGFFVWCSYGITFGSIGILIYLSATQEKRNLKHIADKLKRDERLKAIRRNKNESKA
ncbi:heme exporter protein CcmD [Parashewanella curva]|uniref:Heme exporter protein D n=1 Tax=Parashewanella curva TaxID=2338552 RepID=A0A3L8PYX6_9GAMM|nr:heme exporter protein CcmD [Parashewanella curva]RLV60676.1 heme exporter protein CcmD [Parashewanella curva]